MFASKTINTEKNRKIYSAIKNNDLTSFKQYYLQDPQIAFIKNKAGNNILFHALESRSINIFNFVVSKNPDLLFQQNLNNENVFQYLLNKGAVKELDYFLRNTSTKIKDSIAHISDNDNNNLLGISLLKGQEYFNLYQEHFNKKEDYAHVNNSEQTITHLITLKNAEYAEHLLDKEQFNIRDIRGLTPFLISARYAGLNMFKAISQDSNLGDESPLGSNALHFSAYSGDVQRLQFLLESGFNPNAKNLYENTALSIALVEKKYDFAYELLQKVDSIEFTDVLYMIRVVEKYPALFDYITNNKKLLNETLNDNEKITKFLSHIYYYLPEIKLVENEELLSKLMLEDKNLLNALYFSAIAGRRDFLYKTNFLSDTYGWSETNGQTFQNFHKEHPCGFIYALNQLPKNQFETLIYNSYIIENLSNIDKIVFKLLCINKNSNIYEEVGGDLDFDSIKNDKHLIALLRKTPLEKFNEDLNFFERLSVNLEMSDLITDKIAKNIFYHKTPIIEFKKVFEKTKTKKFKKDIYIKLNELLLSDSSPNLLEIIFQNKYAIMENVLNKMLIESPENFQNFKYLNNNNFIDLEPQSCFSYIKSQGFNKKSFFVMNKSKEFISYFKNLDITKESNFNTDFFKEMMNICDLSEKVTVFNQFLQYSSNNNEIPHTIYSYHFNHFSENEQKYIIKTSLLNYLRDSGTNKNLYKFLEKKYLNFFSETSLKKNILKTADLDFLIEKIKDNDLTEHINIFSSKTFKVNHSLNWTGILAYAEFNKSITKCLEQCPKFSQYALEDFLLVNNQPLENLYQVIKIDKAENINAYKKIIDKLITAIESNSKEKNHIQNIIEEMLFNKNEEIHQLVLENETITTSNYLSSSQSSYIFAHKLQAQLKNQNTKSKKVKI